MQNEFLDYARYVRSMTEKIHYEPTNPSVKNVTVLTEGPGGLPIIPQPKAGVKGEETADMAAIIIRQYFVKHFRSCYKIRFTKYLIDHSAGMATGTSVGRPPWEKFRIQPEDFFDVECLPPNFILQDPSRMGRSVKTLIAHLRRRQEEYGVNAFHFHHIYQNQKVEPSCYPPEAQAIILKAGSDCKLPADELPQMQITVDESPNPKPMLKPTPLTCPTSTTDASAGIHSTPTTDSTPMICPPSSSAAVINPMGQYPSNMTYAGPITYPGLMTKPTATSTPTTKPTPMSDITPPTNPTAMAAPSVDPAAPQPPPMISNSQTMAHPYHPYFPFMFPQSHYPGLPGHMPDLKVVPSIDPQLLPQGPVRFEVPGHVFASGSGGFPNYLQFPSMVAPPVAPNQPETHAIQQQQQTIELIPPKRTPLKRKRRPDSPSPTPSPSVRRGTRTRTPKKLADETVVSLPKWK